MDALITKLVERWASESRIEGGASAFALNGDGMAAVDIEQGIVINFQAQSSPPRLVLFALVAPLPESERLRLMEDMLEANLLWQGTNGATLSLHREDAHSAFEVVLAQSITVHKGTAITELQRAFDNICLLALEWKARLGATPAADTGGDSSPPGPVGELA